MNLMHMRYAVEIARTGSINKAAEALFVAQPNLSRSVKELESDLGITIFDRSTKGMTLTPKGETFIQYAKNVLRQVEEIERICREEAETKQRFSISVPRASYVSEAFVQFSKSISADPAEIFYMETNSNKAINNILNSDYHLGIIRYAANYEQFFTSWLEEKGLEGELIAEFRYKLVLSNDNPLSKKEKLSFEDLKPLIEISHGDPYVPSLPLNVIQKEEQREDIQRHIFLFERGAQFNLLMENPETFMWVSPLPPHFLKTCNLAQKECTDQTKIYKDVLICRKGYRKSELDKRFLKELELSKKRCFFPTL